MPEVQIVGVFRACRDCGRLRKLSDLRRGAGLCRGCYVSGIFDKRGTTSLARSIVLTDKAREFLAAERAA